MYTDNVYFINDMYVDNVYLKHATVYLKLHVCWQHPIISDPAVGYHGRYDNTLCALHKGGGSSMPFKHKNRHNHENSNN